MLQDRSLELATAHQDRTLAKAMGEDYCHPGMRDWAVALRRSDEPAFGAYMAKAGPVFACLFKPTHTAKPYPRTFAAAPEQSPVAAAICA